MKRDKVIDIARGISMILVLMGHCPFVNRNLKIFLCSFHIPLFFFISGMVFSYSKYPKFKDFLKSKTKSLIIPYFSLGIIVIIIKRIYILSKKGLILEFFNLDFLKDIRGLIIGYRLNTEYYFSFWFILALFVAILLFYFIAKYVDKSPKRNAIYIIITIVSSFIGCIIIRFVKGFVWSLDTVPIVIAFITLGYLIKLNKEKILDKVLCFDFIIPALLINGTCTYFNYKICNLTDLYACNIGNYFLYMLQSISGIWFAMIVSDKIGNSKILEYIGKNTLIFYMFHSQVFFIISNDILNNYKFSNNIKFIIEISTTSILLCGLSYIINKFLPFLLGKFGKKQKKEVQNA